MFRPSQLLLFRPMPTLNRFKIHPPLPLNPRESKQLLNLLTTSFRQQLDNEHGEFRPNPDVKPSTRHKSHESAKQRRRSLSDSDSRPTDRHIQSILSNPLFNLVPNGNAPKSDRDPMDIFDQAVSRGMMNLHYARACLNAKKREIIQSSVLSVRQGMRECGAGLNMLRWLVSSGTANDIEFLKDEPFAEVLMEYMVAEGLQEASWKWVKRAFEGLPSYQTISDPAKRIEARRDIVRPLMLLVKAEASGNVSLDAAYMCLSRAAGYLKSMPVPQMRAVLGPPGWFLSHETTMSYSEHQPSSTAAFESFLSIVPVISRHVDYQFAHLHLLHPSQPSADLALAFLRTMQGPESTNPAPIFRNIKEYNLIQLGLDTAKFLLERERYKDAEWIMDCLRVRYPKQLGLEQRRQLEQAKAEASSLQLLEGLSLA